MRIYFQEKARLHRRILRCETAIKNVVGPASEEHFHQLVQFLNKLPKNVMGLSWSHLKNIAEKEDPELAAKQNKVY